MRNSLIGLFTDGISDNLKSNAAWKMRSCCGGTNDDPIFYKAAANREKKLSMF